MSHSKKSVRVIDALGTGTTWTSKRGARRIVARGLAVALPDGTIWMVSADHRLSCSSPSNAVAQFFELVRQFPIDLHYQDDRAVLKFWPEMAQRGIAA